MILFFLFLVFGSGSLVGILIMCLLFNSSRNEDRCLAEVIPPPAPEKLLPGFPLRSKADWAWALVALLVGILLIRQPL